MRIIRRFFLVLVSLVIAAALVLAVMPWKDWLSGWMTGVLQGQGVPVEAMQLQSIGATHMDFSEVQVQTDPPLILPTVRINYTRETLMERRVSDIEIRDIDYHLVLNRQAGDTQQKPLPSPAQLSAIPIDRVIITDSRITLEMEGGQVALPFTASLALGEKAQIAIGGSNAQITIGTGRIEIPDWSIKVIAPEEAWLIDYISVDRPLVEWALTESEAKPKPLDLPMPDALAGIPLNKITVTEAQINVQGEGLEAGTGLHAELVMQPEPAVKIEGDEATITPEGSDGYRISKWQANIEAKDNRWRGRITLPKVVSLGEEPVKWLPVSVTASPVIEATRISVPLTAKHEKFELDTTVNVNTDQQIKLDKTALNVAGGTIRSVSPIVLGRDSQTKLAFKHISLEQLLEFVLGDEDSVKATGVVSGMIPVGYKDGLVSIGTGALNSETTGLLSLGADQLGDMAAGGEQVANVAKLIRHFEYDSLALTTTTDEDGATSFKVALKGRNPEVYEGARVHLNINLQGDVIEAITAYLGLYELPEQLLKGNADDWQNE